MIPMHGDLSARVAAVAEQVGQSVVQVQNEGQRGGLGSGILLNGNGEIVTNAHVVQGSREVRITFHDGVTRPGRVVATDPLYDLALVETHSHLDRSIAFAEESSVKAGHLAVAVGNPFGFGWTVTLGVVSAMDRMLGPLDGLIQTDAAINPGNSGGALVNLEGEVIGIPTAILARGQNLGFAIPGWQALLAVEQFRQHGRAFHPWLGIAGGTEVVDPAFAALLGLPVTRGVAIMEVDPRGPAAAAGLRSFDLIAAVGGTPTPSMAALRKAVRKSEVGSLLNLTVLRGGRLIEVPVRVAELPPALAQR